MDFSQINYLAVLVAGLASFALGSVWYTALFGKAWQKMLGISEDTLQKGSMALIMLSSLVLMLIMAFGLAILIQGHSGSGSEASTLSGLYHGLIVGFVFVGMSIGINYLYQRRSFKLWLIDAGYQILFLGAQGAILGSWH